MTPEEASLALYDRGVRHRIALERYGAGEMRAMLVFLKEAERETLLKVHEIETEGADTLTRQRKLQSLQGLLDELRLVYAEIYQRMVSRLIDGLDELAKFEAEFTTRSLARALQDLGEVTAIGRAEAAAGAVRILVPTATQLAAVVRSRPMTFGSQTDTMRAFLEGLEESHFGRMETALRLGFVEGESISAIAERVREAGAVNARSAEAIARTAITHVAAEVAQESYEANADLVTAVEWVAVLDSRTTAICRSRDGQQFPLNSGPRPPAHPRCRSTVIPIVEGLPAPKRATYGDWLRRQPAHVQDDVLGPERAKLFRAGAVKVEQFTDDSGRTLTLKDLRRMLGEDGP